MPAGSACSCDSYVNLLAQSLAPAGDAGITHNEAVPGIASGGVLSQLGSPAIQSYLADANLVIVTIGANDFKPDVITDVDCSATADLQCYQPTLSALQTNMQQILTTISRLNLSPKAHIAVTGYWNVFQDGTVGRSHGLAYVANSDALTRAVNSVIKAAALQARMTYVDLYEPFKGDGTKDDTALLASDGDHPDAEGHRLIAQSIAGALSVGSTA